MFSNQLEDILNLNSNQFMNLWSLNTQQLYDDLNFYCGLGYEGSLESPIFEDVDGVT